MKIKYRLISWFVPKREFQFLLFYLLVHLILFWQMF